MHVFRAELLVLIINDGQLIATKAGSGEDIKRLERNLSAAQQAQRAPTTAKEVHACCHEGTRRCRGSGP